MNTLIVRAAGGRGGAWSLALLALVLFVALPVALDGFRLNMCAKYLSLGFVAIGLVLCWGYGGILSLGQGVFWGLGGYCMAAFLKLEAAASIANEAGTDQKNALTTVGLPDFMDWNQITELPWFWYPFKSLPLSIGLGILLPVAIAYVVGTAMFKRRVAGVYFALITQALCWIMEILFVTRQGWTGGINGITDLRTMWGWDIRTTGAQTALYFVTAGLAIAVILVGRLVLTSKLGRLLLAVRDTEDRVRFSGYDVANIKTFVFCLASAISALGGMLFVLNVGFMSPKLVTIEPSILMVIFCAVGGRMSLVGAVYGTLLVCFGRTYFSEQFPALWYFLIGGAFILTTMAFPDGLAGIARDHGWRLLALFKRRAPTGGPGGGARAPDPTPPTTTPQPAGAPGA